MQAVLRDDKRARIDEGNDKRGKEIIGKKYRSYN